MQFSNWLARYPEVSTNDLLDEYDFIIVGGGTAGCVLANRLSNDPSKTVLLVERGPLADTWVSRVPLFSMNFEASSSPSWKHPTVTQSELGRSLDLYTGSALGGTSRINICLYTRGLPAEYDTWKAAGRQGWGWDDVLPYFMKSENSGFINSPEVHGTQGEWRNRSLGGLAFPSYKRVVQACQDVGLPFIQDLNCAKQPSIGCARLDHTIDNSGHRHSTARAFLPKDLALQRRSNLHICTDATVHKLDIDVRSDGRKITRGIVLAGNHGKATRTIHAKEEVILCSGPFGSPKLLMLSGVGPSRHLKEHKIPVVKALPAVGSNLQDHYMVDLTWRIPLRDSLSIYIVRPWLFILAVLRYVLFGTGILIGHITQLAIFVSSTSLDDSGGPSVIKPISKDTLPDIEILPGVHPDPNAEFDKKHGRFSFINVLLHPLSKGAVRLASSAPDDPLVIDPAVLTNQKDYTPLRAALRLSMRLASQMHNHLSYKLDPLDVPESEDNATLDALIRQRVSTAFHYSSTCRMAPEDDPAGGGVVDDQLRVHGIERLRVADSSIFPWILGTHLQAPTVMVAEKCADMISRPKSE